MHLWKKRKNTGIKESKEQNIWNVHFESQKKVCNKYGSDWTPTDMTLVIGVADDLTADPVHGLRHPNDKETTDKTAGWFIWSGEYSENEDFFKPMCAEHLLQIRPEIIKYLGLNVGYRFLVGGNG